MSGRWFDCCKCREQIYLTDSQEDLLRKTQQEFFCRWGHKQHFPAGKTELRERGEIDHWQSIQCSDLAVDVTAARAALLKASPEQSDV